MIVMLILSFKAVRQGINVNLATVNNMNAMQAQKGWGQPGGMSGMQTNMMY